MQISVRPQLCKTLDEKKFQVMLKEQGHAIAEPKFDGLRCIVGMEGNEVQAFSRNGKPFWNIDHILEEIRGAASEDAVLDGELFTTDWNLSMGIVKSSKTIHPDAIQVKLHVWDYIPLDAWKRGVCNLRQKERQQLLREFFHIYPGQFDNINGCFQHLSIVQGRVVKSLEEARKAYQDFVGMRYEGAVIKFPNSIYELGKRSPEWLKWKPFIDADLVIVGCVEGEGKRSGKVGALKLDGDVWIDDRCVHVNSEAGVFRCPDSELERMWQMHQDGELLGLKAEVRFDSVTSEGAMRFPRFYRLREDREKVLVNSLTGENTGIEVP